LSRTNSNERRDYIHEVRKHRVLWVRLAFTGLGTLFLLLATACYARSWN
jgi:hypothetical protein